ncbi:S-layer homology domain-containing protein [Sedimentibacter sp. zth1]|uniref:S-layer homology domain-containing protein n=1 Tax=Sedimentibacter sp. zth1 TaxID=2816908 RepID=UPI001A91B729|nr:S-layer homology domain-containing protein [Sedimentibacter sp. zth1]QSX05271.1 S-layer homology domain-containing protein [Sedimentibacter sp. zth1]
MKKVLSLVVIIAMVLSSMSFAFASTFEDVDAENEKLVEATNLLNSLGIIKGYEDGSFKPEKTVKRAEMAKMLIVALGYGEIASDTPIFTDCQTHWAKGYIALANDLGIIEGKGNGIFDPEAPVTYEQAATMLLRALGYTNESVNGGKSDVYNGAAYRTRALNLNLFKDFSLTGMKDGANRGDIALMLNRNLSNSKVYTGDNGRFVIEKDENNNPVKLLSAIAEKVPMTVTAKNVADNKIVDLSSYLYQTIVAYVKDGSVVFVEDVTSATKSGYLTNANVADVKLYGIDDVYAIEKAEAPVFYNNAEAEYKDVKSVLAGSVVKLVLNDDEKVIGIIADEETSADFITSEYRTNSTLLGTKIYLPTKSNKVDLSKVTVTGAVNDINDIEVGDVVKAYASLNNTQVELLVVRDSIEGKVIKTNTAKDEVYVDTIGEYRDVVIGTIEIGSEGTFYFDEDGNIFQFVGKNIAVAQEYQVVTVATDATLLNGAGSTLVLFDKATIKVMNAAGEVEKYKLAKDATLNYVDADHAGTEAYDVATGVNNIAVGTIVTGLTLNDDEEVTNVTTEALVAGNKTINATKSTFVAASDLVIFNEINTADGNVYVANTLEQLQAKGDIAQTNFKYITNEIGEYSVIFVTGTTVVDAKSTFGLIASQQVVLNGDLKPVQELVVYINGEAVTYVTSTDVATQTVGKDIKSLSISDGVIVGVADSGLFVTPVSNTTTSTAISSVVGTRFQTEANSEWYFMDENAPVYIVDKDGEFVRVASLQDITALDVDVQIYHDASNIVSAIVISLK